MKTDGISEAKLQWDVVSIDKVNELGHCAFSNEEVTPVDLAFLYSGGRFRGKEETRREEKT